MLAEGVLDGQDDLVEGERLFEEVEGAELGRLDGRLDGAVARDDHDFGRLLEGRIRLRTSSPFISGSQISRRTSPKLPVSSRARPSSPESAVRVLVALVLQDALKRGPDARFVVDDQDAFGWFMRAAGGEFSPVGRLFWTSIIPLCSFTIWLTMARPRPVPFFFVEKWGRKSLSLSSTGMPGPVSATSIAHLARLRVVRGAKGDFTLFAHGVNSVVDQVDQDPLHLLGVEGDRPGRRPRGRRRIATSA